MIFVTVGTDLPFDRMLKVIDSWAQENQRRDIFAQIGEGGWEPSFIEFTNFLEPPDFRRRFEEASLIISHAGMGTILSALLRGKPILVMPKLASLGEQRNEHQTATARRMAEIGNVHVAYDEAGLRKKLDHLDDLKPPVQIGESADTGLLCGLREFIHNTQSQVGNRTTW